MKYVARLGHVREVTLLGEADLDFWGDRLREHDLAPAPEGGKAQILIIAADARFAGVRFREVSASVVVSPPGGEARRDAAFLVHAFNSSRFFALCERAFFKTPYHHGDARVSSAYPPSIRVGLGGGLAFLAEMRPDPTGAVREPSRVAEDGWEGPVFLPGGRLFFAKLRGQTREYPFRDGEDSVAIRPSPGGPAVLQALVDSRFAGKTWIVRDDAEHAKSKTYSREDVLQGKTPV